MRVHQHEWFSLVEDNSTSSGSSGSVAIRTDAATSGASGSISITIGDGAVGDDESRDECWWIKRKCWRISIDLEWHKLDFGGAFTLRVADGNGGVSGSVTMKSGSRMLEAADPVP